MVGNSIIIIIYMDCGRGVGFGGGDGQKRHHIIM